MAWLYKQPTSPNWYIGLTEREQKILQKKNFSTGTADKRRANEELKITKSEIIQKKDRPIVEKNNLTFQQAYKLMKQDRANTKGAYSQKTLAVYEVILGIIKETFGDKLISEYDRNDYHYLVNRLGIKHNSKAAYIKKINAVFNFLVREKYLKENPFKTIRPIHREVIIKTTEEVNKLLDFVQGTDLYWLFRFQIASAFRINEVLTTTREKIEPDIIRVTRKGNVPNYIPIIGKMRDLLKEMPLPEEGRLFPFSYDEVRYILLKFEKETGICFVSHDLRKYMLSTMANAGIAPKFITDYAGHNDSKTTDKYYIRLEKKKMAEDIDAKLLYTELYKPTENPQNDEENEQSIFPPGICNLFLMLGILLILAVF